MNKLFGDLKTDEEKSNFFLSGRGYETGVIAAAIQNDVAMAYHRCAEYKKELAALQAAHDEEIFQVRQDRDTHFGELMRALEQVDAMKAECEKLRKDAERYQWLRKGAHEDSDLDRWEYVGYVCGVSICTAYGVQHVIDGDELDAAIDAAMQEERNP